MTGFVLFVSIRSSKAKKTRKRLKDNHKLINITKGNQKNSLKIAQNVIRILKTRKLSQFALNAQNITISLVLM